MLNLQKLVETKLGSRADGDTLELWSAIWDSYEKGGPDAVESELQKRLKAVKSAATKEIQEAKKVVPKRKAKRRRR